MAEDKRSFEAMMLRLSEIVEKLEQNESNLEKSIELFEEGLDLIMNCDSQLKHFEDKVGELMKAYNGNVE